MAVPGGVRGIFSRPMTSRASFARRPFIVAVWPTVRPSMIPRRLSMESYRRMHLGAAAPGRRGASGLQVPREHRCGGGP